MNLKELKLRHFRNYEDASFSFQGNSIHVLTGRNAQGKTNLIEAIYFLAHLRSFRISSPEALKMYGSDFFFIEAALESQQRDENLKVSVVKNKKNLFRNDQPVRTFSSFVGLCNAILFSPDDLMLFSASPKERRKFIDVELIKLDPVYTVQLSEYQKLLKQKNLALKQDVQDWNLIDVYTSQMISLQCEIMKKRQQFIDDLNTEASRLYPFFAQGPEVLTLKYSTFAPIDDSLEESVAQACWKAKERERFSRTTAVGIHKDDIQFLMNDRPVLANASQGQKRSFLLALKLAVASLIKQRLGEYPILLLDDVFSELDEQRRRQLLDRLPLDMQIFITTTETVDLSDIERPVVFYSVDRGVIERKDVINE